MADKSLNGQTVLVTGASRGIGRGIALALGERGARVAVDYRGNKQAAESVVAKIMDSGGDAFAVQADISSAEDRKRLLDEVLERSGGRLDLLVNNAGIAPRLRADILEADEDSFDEMVSVNLKGPYFLTQAASGAMIEAIRSGLQPDGRIITITSISAYTASVNRGDYCVAKAGLSMMTKLFAARLAGEKILVYEVRPGVTDTDMTSGVKENYDERIKSGLTPIRRWGTPEDIAACVSSIAEGAFPFSTGTVFDVDGGFHLRIL